MIHGVMWRFDGHGLTETTELRSIYARTSMISPPLTCPVNLLRMMNPGLAILEKKLKRITLSAHTMVSSIADSCMKLGSRTKTYPGHMYTNSQDVVVIVVTFATMRPVHACLHAKLLSGR